MANPGTVMHNPVDEKIFGADDGGVPRTLAQRVTSHSTAKGYKIGDLCIQNGQLWIATADNGPSVFNHAVWDGMAGVEVDNAGVAIQVNWEFSASHGMAQIPSRVQGYIECLSPEHGYAIGDRIYLANSFTSGGGGTTVFANALNVGIMFHASPLLIVSRSTGAGVQATTINWTCGARVWA